MSADIRSAANGVRLCSGTLNYTIFIRSKVGKEW